MVGGVAQCPLLHALNLDLHVLVQGLVVGQRLVEDDVEHEGRVERHQCGAGARPRHQVVGEGQRLFVGAHHVVVPNEQVEFGR